MVGRLSGAVAAALVVSFVFVFQAAAAPEIREERIDVGGYKINSVFVPATGRAELPPIVFIHGASASLYDPMGAFVDKLQGRADLLFVDRPGHGHSDRGGRRQLQDIVTCIRTRTTIDEVGFERERHADRYLKPPEEMERLFPRYRQALARTIEIARRCTFSLEELTYQYPEEAIVSGKDAQSSLEHYVWQCVPDRYPEGLPPDVLKTVRHELDWLTYLIMTNQTTTITTTSSRRVIVQFSICDGWPQHLPGQRTRQVVTSRSS